MNYKGAEEYILKRLQNELPANLYYHSVRHTLDVTDFAVKYGIMEKLNEEELLLLKTAALYHDCGFLLKYNDNEITSVQIVKDILPSYGYSSEHIEIISKMILSTGTPQNPCTLMEKILCDADLDYLGRDDFFMNGICLKREWNVHGMNITLKEWYINELKFLQQHEYYTQSANKLRKKKKIKHIEQIKELLKNSL